MKKLLIVGASVLQLPAVLKAKEMGLTVAVADYDPAAIGISYADKYYNVSTIDEEGIYRAAEAFGADGIMTLATDMPMRSIAYACEKLKLPGLRYDTAIKATDKGEMIKTFQEAGVAHPWFFVVKDETEFKTVINDISYPCVIKPSDNSGNRGVVIAENVDTIYEAYEYSRKNSRCGDVVIEEFLLGREVSVEIIVWKGEPHVIAVTDKLTNGKPHFIEMGHSQPAQFPEDVMTDIIRLAKDAVRALGNYSGAAHAEIMVTENGPKMIEIGARLGGGCINTHLVPLSTGVDMVENAIRCSLGEPPLTKRIFNKAAVLRHIPVETGRIKSISGVEEARSISGVKDIVFLKKTGDYIEHFIDGTNRIGMVIAQADTVEEGENICESALAYIKVEYET